MSASRGFTLVEVVLSLAMTGVVVVSAATLANKAVRSSLERERVASSLSALDALDRAIRIDLHNIDTQPRLPGPRVLVAEGALEIVTRDRGPLRARYELRTGSGEGGERTLVRRSGDHGHGAVMLEGVKSWSPKVSSELGDPYPSLVVGVSLDSGVTLERVYPLDTRWTR